MQDLASKLTKAREGIGLSIIQAAERMPSLSPQALRHIEGRRKGCDAPAGPDLRLCTVLDIYRVYHPKIKLKDFADPDDSRPNLAIVYEDEL